MIIYENYKIPKKMVNTKAFQTLQQSNKKVFTIVDVKALLDIQKDNTAYKKIKSLVRANILARAKRGVYYLADNPPSDFEMANFLYVPSYISLESALNYYGILNQISYIITSVTPNLTKKILGKQNKTFLYRHIDQKYFSNFEKQNNILIASPEKALVDSLFLMSLGKLLLNIEELNLDIVDKKKIGKLSNKIKHSAFHKLVKKNILNAR